MFECDYCCKNTKVSTTKPPLITCLSCDKLDATGKFEVAYEAEQDFLFECHYGGGPVPQPPMCGWCDRTLFNCICVGPKSGSTVKGD